VRVGLVTSASTVRIGALQGLTVTGPDGGTVGAVPAGADWVAAGAGIAIALRADGGGSLVGEQLVVRAADSTDFIRVNGRPYRGEVTLLRGAVGVTVVNRVPLELYLASVVSSEMGRRDSAEIEALRAQAIVSRTYALRNLGRWRAQGFDLQAGVGDQVYGGALNETTLGNEAVAETRGRVLTYNGELVDAFFFSTCGGRTAGGVEVFRGADRPYLRSLDDVDHAGRAWCSISPRFRWREEWSGEALGAMLRRTLPDVARVPPEGVGIVRDVRVAARSASGRVATLEVVTGSGPVSIEGQAVRQVLRLATGEPLRSSAFTLAATGAGHRVSRLVAEGGGAGHGVGLCQWGAVGRARAGQAYGEILAAYFPGTALTAYY
jgi:stage II sporulation protein D